MSNILIARWFDVNEHLPKDCEYKIVRCINQDEYSDFYFMAYYHKESKAWDFFDDYNTTMQVTHWMKTPKINNLIKFILNKGEE